MKTEFTLDIKETVNGDLMVKEVRPSALAIPFSKSVSITIVRRKTTSDESVVKAFVHDHSSTEVVNRFPIAYDGTYIVTHAVIPTELPEEDNTYSRVIIYKDGELYEAVGGQLTQTNIEVLYEDLIDSNVQIEQKDTFILFNLWQCYLNYCKKQFEGECSKISKCSDCKNELTENRNLLWIFLNTLQYLVKLGKIDKAQELLEDISGCNTLCSNEMFSKQYDCGCGK